MNERPNTNQDLIGERRSGDEQKFCTNCGQSLEPGARFCNNCGAKTEALLEQNSQTSIENSRLSSEMKQTKTEDDSVTDMGFNMERMIQENDFSPEMVSQLVDLYKSTEKSIVDTNTHLQALEEKGINVSSSLAQRMNSFLLKMNERKVVLERIVDKARDAGLISAQSEEDLQKISRIFPRGSRSQETGEM